MREESSSSLLSFLLLSSCDDCLLLSAWHTPEEVEELPRSNWPVVGLSVGNCLDHWLLSEGPALCGWKHPWEGWIRKPGDGEPECEIVSYVPTHVRFSSCMNFCPDFPWWPTYDPWDELFPFLTHVGKVLAFLVLVFIKTKDTLSFLHASVLVEGSSLFPPQFASVFSGDLDSLSSLTTLPTLVAPSSYTKQNSPQPRSHALLNYFLFSSPPTDLSGQKQHVCLYLLTHLGSHGFSGLLHFWFCFPAPASPDTNGSHSPLTVTFWLSFSFLLLVSNLPVTCESLIFGITLWLGFPH